MATTTAELIAAAKTKLAAVIDENAAKYVDYKVGDKSVSKSQYVRHLMNVIENLSKQEASGVELEIMQFDADISLVGKDETQYTIL